MRWSAGRRTPSWAYSAGGSNSPAPNRWACAMRVTERLFAGSCPTTPLRALRGRTSAEAVPLAARRQLLHRPTVAVGVAEEHGRTPGKLLHVADLHPTLRQLGMRRVDVGDN